MSTWPRVKVYLGDGVYCAIEHGALVLTTENGTLVTNRIVLRPEVYDALVRWGRDTERGEPEQLNR